MGIPVQIAEYSPVWPQTFMQLRGQLLPLLDGLVVDIEHVGSTAVPGRAAKPIVDLDLIVRDAVFMPQIIRRLATLDCVHLGNLGIAGRVAFGAPFHLPPHYLYSCLELGRGLRNHLALRDLLRSDPAAVAEYSRLKRMLAARSMDVDSYCRAKTECILGLLLRAGVPQEDVEVIRRENLGMDA